MDPGWKFEDGKVVFQKSCEKSLFYRSTCQASTPEFVSEKPYEQQSFSSTQRVCTLRIMPSDKRTWSRVGLKDAAASESCNRLAQHTAEVDADTGASTKGTWPTLSIVIHIYRSDYILVPRSLVSRKLSLRLSVKHFGGMALHLGLKLHCCVSSCRFLFLRIPTLYL